MIKAKDAEIVLLVGSQRGKTETFANLLKEALLAVKQKAVVFTLDDYTLFPKMKQLIVLTSTFGKGMPPANAKNFLNLLEKVKNPATVSFSVVGFGSVKYPKFCQFAKEVHSALLEHKNFILNVKPVYIDRSCFSTFLNWSKEWSAKSNVRLTIEKLKTKPKTKRYQFKVKKYYRNADDPSQTIFIELATKKHKKLKKGDLLVVGSKKTKEQHYPIEKLKNKNVLIAFHQNEAHTAIKHFGKLKKKFKARHICNTHFQLLSEGMSFTRHKFPNTKNISSSKLLKKLG